MDNGLVTLTLDTNGEVKFLQPAQAFAHLQTILQNINIPYLKVKQEVEYLTELRANCAAGLDMQDVSFEQIANNLRLPKELSVELAKKGQLFIQSEKFLNQYMGNNLCMETLSEFNHYLEVGAGTGTSAFNNDTLFSSVPAPLVSLNDDLVNLFDELYNKSTTDKVLYNSWLLHHDIIKHAHFFKRKPMVARLLQYSYLKQHNMHLYGMLALEEMLLKYKAEYDRLINLIEKEDVLGEFMQFGVAVHSKTLKITEQRIKHLYRTDINYKKLAPWQRNLSNYLFSKGFDMKLAGNSAELNARQSEILQIILKDGFVSTKDMVEKFECNRKTIQRDFAELLEANLVRAIGKGSALRYGLSLKDKTNNYLERYQTVQLDDALLSAAQPRKPRPRKQERPDENQALSQAS